MFGEKKGLTLVELLVVIAVIVLMIAVIAPVMARGRDRAKSIICKANLNKYYVAMENYLGDNDERYPLSFISVFDGRQSGIPLQCQWHDERIAPWNDERRAGALWPYMQTSKIHVCPTFRALVNKSITDHPWPYYEIPLVPLYSYSQNNFLGQSYGVLKKSEVVEPSRVLVFTEETLWIIKEGGDYLASHTLNDTCFFPRHPNDQVGFPGDCVATYHMTSWDRKNYGLGNAVFVDGHVSFVDAWNSRETSWGSVRSSFYHAWPKKGALSEVCPY